MTHTEAVDRSRRLLGHQLHCHHELIRFNLVLDSPPGTAWWACMDCKIAMLIDPTGVIRDTLPLEITEKRLEAEDERRHLDPGI